MAIHISEYLQRIDDFEVDYNYQRPSGAWSTEDKQCFIDTIIKNLPVPLFFFNRRTNQNGRQVNFVVDGQQRLDCIKDFRNGVFPLSGKFSGQGLHNMFYNDLDETNKRKFLNYSLQEKTLENLSDEKVRSMFSRLQRGKPLNLNEKLNAFPGTIVPTVRAIMKNRFFENSIKSERKSGYRMISVIGRMLYYEFYGLRDASPNALKMFFEEKKNLSDTSPEVAKVKRVLNYLANVFPNSNEGVYVFTGDAWILAIYMMVSKLLSEYSLVGLETQINTFLQRFWRNIYDRQIRQGDSDYNDFYDRIRGGWSNKNQTTRRDILIERFLTNDELPVLDDSRQISTEEKMNIFAQDNHCQVCGKEFTTFNEGEYHHRIRWIDGGRTSSDNIVLLCAECHDKVHVSNDNILIDNTILEEIESEEDVLEG